MSSTGRLGDDALGGFILGGEVTAASGTATPAEVLDHTSTRFTAVTGTQTVSHTVSAGAGTTKLFVWISYWIGWANSVTYAGQSLTLHSRRTNTVTEYELWVLNDPPVGTADVSIDFEALSYEPGAICGVGVYTIDHAGDIEQHRAYNLASGTGWDTTNDGVTEPLTVGSLLLCQGAKYYYDSGSSFTWNSGITSIFEQEPSSANQVWIAGGYKSVSANPETFGIEVTSGSSVAYIGIVSITSEPPAELPGPPEGDGEVPTGTNPSAGVIPSTLPLKFVQIRLASGTSYYFAETQLNDGDAWYGGKKPGKLLNISSVRRELSTRGAYVTSRCTVTLADTDRQLRALVASNALRGAYVALYVVDDATRRAEGVPLRYFAGLITAHRADSGFRYTLELEDVIGRRLAEYAKQPQLPPDVFTANDFPAIDILQTGADGKPIPLVCGFVSDQHESNPQGVVPCTYVGTINFADAWGGTDTDVDAYVWSQGCFPTNGVWQVFYNDPADPSVRQIVPSSAWGSVVWTAGQTGWSDTGLSTDYADYNGRRYASPLFVARSLGDLADAARDGRVFIAANIYGLAADPNGGDVLYIDSPVRLWQFLLTNYVFNRYTQESSYFTLPTLDGTYTIIDTDTVAAVDLVHAARLSGGYKAGFVLGADQQETVFDVLQRLAEGCDFDWGVNRHGQLIVSAENTAESASVSFNSQDDIEDGQYEVWTDSDGYINRVEHTYGYRYIPPVAPPATPTSGEPVPTKLPPYSEWRSGLLVTENTTAQTTVGEVATYSLNNYMVQDAATALNVADTVLQRGLGPEQDGPRMFRFTTGWQGLQKAGVDIELGSVISVLHPERVGASASGTDTCRVLAIEVDPLRDRVTLEGRVIA